MPVQPLRGEPAVCGALRFDELRGLHLGAGDEHLRTDGSGGRNDGGDVRRAGHDARSPGPDGAEALRRRLALDDVLLWARVEDGFLRAGRITATSVRRPVAAPDGSRWPLSEQTFVVYPACGGAARLAVESEGETDVRFTLHPSPLPSRRAPFPEGVETLCLRIPAGARSSCSRRRGRVSFRPGWSLRRAWRCWAVRRCPGVLAGSCAEAEWFHPSLTLSKDDLYAPQNVQDGYLRPWGGPRA